MFCNSICNLEKQLVDLQNKFEKSYNFARWIIDEKSYRKLRAKEKYYQQKIVGLMRVTQHKQINSIPVYDEEHWRLERVAFFFNLNN
jgi:hypothetical protein